MTNDRRATAGGRWCHDDAAMDGSDLDPDVRRFIRTIGAAMARYPRFERAPYPEARRFAEEARAPWRQGGPEMLESREIAVPTRHGTARIRIHRPAGGILPGLVYLHGGGWTLFSIDTHDRVMREYASRAGCCVIGVDYALSPERKFPVPLEQVVDVVDWVAEHGMAFGIEAGRLAIGGDSAGANLSVAACLVRRDKASRPSLHAMLLNYGAFASHCSDEACRRFGGPEYMLSCEEMNVYWRNYMRSDADARNPLVCPLLAALEGLPPAFLAIAECDVLAEQNREMARRLKDAGVPTHSEVYAGASHSFLEAVSVAGIANRALADGAGWLRETLQAATPGVRPEEAGGAPGPQAWP